MVSFCSGAREFQRSVKSLLLGSGATSKITFLAFGLAASLAKYSSSLTGSCLRESFSFSTAAILVGFASPRSTFLNTSAAVLKPKRLNVLPRASKKLFKRKKMLPISPAGGFVLAKSAKASAMASSWMYSSKPLRFLFSAKYCSRYALSMLGLMYLPIHSLLALLVRTFHSSGVNAPNSFRAWIDSCLRVPIGFLASTAILIKA